jgi:hypothetical protein
VIVPIRPEYLKLAILKRLKEDVIADWQLVEIYNTLAQCAVFEANGLDGCICGDEDDVQSLKQTGK